MKNIRFIIGLAVLAVFVVTRFFFTLRTGETAVATTFGKTPRAAVTEPGLYLRWPWPIQDIHRFDNRLRCLESAFEETFTRDQKNIVVMLYAGWRIKDAVLFLQRLGSESAAEAALEGLLRHYKNTVFGAYDFSDFVNADPQRLKFEEAERAMLEPVQKEAAERYGVEVTVLGIKKLALPESITANVFERMRNERKAMADRYRAEGEAEATRIRAEAEKQRELILAEAQAEAKRIQALGEAEAAEYYAVFEKNPELAVFLRKLETLEKTIDANSVLVLGTDTVPYDLLRGGGTNEAAAAGPGKER